ncbi:hypothetical protein L1277_001102 [Okibacterium sp. HSC-33S16]|uniref:Z1 domain-containing protein n=1 Tax=Okibacterium sp. HSC-33S16 TaxID=2910965 RepID=UPI0020A1E0E6|nr:Z1 domain-containing protein [Okibacterium sp. HSC-33S16]MCP2031011.1 hypothetical protein [Okibacterium sp. HSC-33S16]
MNDVQQKQYLKLKNMLMAAAAIDVPSEHELRTLISELRGLGPDLTDEHLDIVFDEVSKVSNVIMDMGVMIEAGDRKPWLADRKDKIEWRLWDAYRRWMTNTGRSPRVIDVLDQTLDTILDHMGDPMDKTPWARRGLVIGDVQSGKTGTYIGLINKAADAGYRYVILLTGNTESLRQQTQSRVDQGVIGRDSLSLSRADAGQPNKSRHVGIGRYLESTSSAMSLTTMTMDFRKTSIEAVDFNPGPDNIVVFVTKKNKLILKRIADWLEQQGNAEKRVNQPLLLIDDESDYASIDTTDEDEDPTAINAAIRRLLSIFDRSSYVGFTATPFANIFISDEVEDDLFPRDFIFGLEAPSNYIGAGTIFNEQPEGGADPIRVIDDAEDAFPLSHKSQHAVFELPESLIGAVRTFIVANTIRDLRGDAPHPRSMLINVSRFNSVQAQVQELVAELLAAYKNAISLHAKTFAKGKPNDRLAELQDAFDDEFSDLPFTWDEVLEKLPASSSGIQTLLMNSKTEQQIEQDELSSEAPPRLIAVGGDMLSRGLTLDGLMVSYFYRRTAAADTLMQMGRWFGYRDGYEDLCRIWINNEMQAAFGYAARTLDELRTELVRMRNQKLTPEQYGLAVRNHPDALLITARNKMRSAKVGSKSISLRGHSIESYKLSSENQDLTENYTAFVDLVEELGRPDSGSRTNRPVWTGVDKKRIAKFMQTFRAHPSSQLFQEGALSRFIRNASADDLQRWDVVVVGGQGSSLSVGEVSFAQPIRGLSAGDDGSWLVSKRNQRVAGAGDVATTLGRDRAKRIANAYLSEAVNKKGVPDTAYVAELERPLLLVYPIEPKGLHLAAPAIAVNISIPGARNDDSGSSDEDQVTYLLNRVAQRLWFPELLAGDDV